MVGAAFGDRLSLPRETLDPPLLKGCDENDVSYLVTILKTFVQQAPQSTLDDVATLSADRYPPGL